MSGVTMLLLARGPLWAAISLVPLLLLAGAAVLVWQLRQKSAGAAGAQASEQTSHAARQLVRDAQQALWRSQRGGRRALASATLVYVLGDSNSAKTTSILRSELEPELLAGDVYRDGDVVPTRLGNVWYSQSGLLLEAGTALWKSHASWRALLGRLRTGGLRSIAGGGTAARAAVVCVSCEAFFGADAARRSRTLAEQTNAMLRLAARELGTDLPVYVLFTKLDRVQGFQAFVGRLRSEEVLLPLGVALPRQSQGPSLYAEGAAAEIARSLDRLLFSLGEFRLEALARESLPEARSSIYEFPREMTKLRNNLLDYLVEVARPTHLSANPFLRGFYWTGVRSFEEEAPVSAPAAVGERQYAALAQATGVFSIQGRHAAEAVVPRSVTQRGVQWCFLPHFFPDVVFADAAALGHTRQPGQRALVLRRLALGVACALLLLLLAGTTTSFVRNRQLEAKVHDAAEHLRTDAALNGLAGQGQLADLDQLRALLVELETNERDGAPLGLRWGLYHGDALIEPARSLYFDRFQSLLLARTQANLSRTLAALPATASATADYGEAYRQLRAYLITTAYSEKSTKEFLPPVLLRAWLGNDRPSTGEQSDLAERQFAFYAEELRQNNPYRTPPVMSAVTTARTYLNSFGSLDRVYRNILAVANAQVSAIEFNRAFPGSAATVVDSHSVPGAFTQRGYGVVMAALQHPERYFAGESWVLGDAAAPALQPTAVQTTLGARYAADFGAEWRAFLRAASVVRSRSLPDAQAKLQSLASPGSALLELFWTVSRNTAVEDPAIAKQFQPTQVLVSPTSTDRLIGSGNTTYVNGLQSLEGAVAQFGLDPAAAANPGAAQPVIAAAVAAHTAVGQTAQSFTVDQGAHIEQMVVALLHEPITSVEDLVRNQRPEQLNAAARPFCSALGSLASKYPFSRSASTEASAPEVETLLKPGTGSLWQLYDSSLKGALRQQGESWVAVPGTDTPATPAFLRLFNRLATLSRTFFAGATPGPRLTLTVHLPQNKQIQSVTFALDGQRIAGADVSREFAWSLESASSAQLLANYGTGILPLQFSGPWSLFHLSDRGTVESFSPLRLAYPLEISRTPIVVQGTPLVERLEFSGAGAGVLAPGALEGLRCPTQIVR